MILLLQNTGPPPLAKKRTKYRKSAVRQGSVLFSRFFSEQSPTAANVGPRQHSGAFWRETRVTQYLYHGPTPHKERGHSLLPIRQSNGCLRSDKPVPTTEGLGCDTAEKALDS